MNVDNSSWLKLSEALLKDSRLSCYCADGVFCHTVILAYYMASLWPHMFLDGTPPKSISIPVRQYIYGQVIKKREMYRSAGK